MSTGKSEVWTFFKKVASNSCICNLCGKNYKTGGGTTNLKNHLLHKHPLSINSGSQAKKCKVSETETTQEADTADDDVELIPLTLKTSSSQQSRISQSLSPTPVSTCSHSSTSGYKQPTIKSIFKDQKSYEAGGVKESAITQSIIYMICKDNMPLQSTEKEGLQKLLKTTVPLYQVPSRKTITKHIEQKYDSLKALVKQELSKISRMSITTDIATVMNATRSFLVLTLHYIDDGQIPRKESSIISMCLGVKSLTPHHTAKNICDDLKQMLETWGIQREKVVSATTDNGANIVSGVKKLFLDDNLDCSIHVPCFAHNINLVVTTALQSVKDIAQLIGKVKTIVSYFKHSNVAQDDLRDEQRKEGKCDGTFLYLIQEIATRWNSTFYCLERFHLLSAHVGKILLSPTHKEGPPMLTSPELLVISECLTLLRPFEEATRDISGEKYMSGSLVIPMTNCVKTSLERTAISSPSVQTLKSELLKQIEKRLRPCEQNSLLSVATLLDPRFKKIHFNSAINATKAVNIVKVEVRRELKGSNSPPLTLDNKDNTSEGGNRTNIWAVHEEVAAKNLPEQGSIQIPQGLPTELKLYLSQPIQPRNSDPIQYWIDSKNAFPATYQVAMKYLTVMGASVSSERVVSALNNICTDQRSRLTPKHANQLVFLGSLHNSFWEM